MFTGRLAVQGICQALANLELTEEQLQLLDADLALAQSGVRMRDVILAERAGIMSLSEGMSEMEDEGGIYSLYQNFRLFQFHDQAALLEVMRFDANIVDDNSLGLAEQSDAMHKEKEKQGVYCLMTNLMTPATTTLRDTGLNYRQQLIHARLALRIEHHRRRTGSLPEALLPSLGTEFPTAELEFSTALRSHLPPVYRVTENGFELYDMGEDQEDSQLQPRIMPDDDWLAKPDPDGDETSTLVEVNY